jgi:hypothetical protein
VPAGCVEWVGEALCAGLMALVAFLAQSTGIATILFPELGALSHDVFKRPHGTWARAPLMLVVTPLITGVVGTLVTRTLPYGFVSVLLTIGSAILIIRLMRSPIAPAISAGLLPLTLGVKSWLYLPGLLVGLVLLAGLSLVWRRVVPPPVEPPSSDEATDDLLEEPPVDYSWVPFYFVFLLVAIGLVQLTGWRFLLFPPLVVIGFEMFSHASVCPWAQKPLLMPLACALTGAAGVLLVSLLGAGPLAAVVSVAFGVAVLRVFRLHIPPALAVGLLPMVIPHPTYNFPLAVAAGTALLTASFLIWQALTRWRSGRTT